MNWDDPFDDLNWSWDFDIPAIPPAIALAQ